LLPTTHEVVPSRLSREFGEYYSPVPPFHGPGTVAEALRVDLCEGPGEPIDVWALVENRGWSTQRRRLSAIQGGLQACISPSIQHEFVVVVDEDPSPSERWESIIHRDPRVLRSALGRFRLAHELAHSFFYRPGRPPERSTPPTLAEETYCDDFAAALLVPPFLAADAFEAGAAAISDLAARFVAPAKVVLRSANMARSSAAIAGEIFGSTPDRLDCIIGFRQGLSDPPALWAQCPELYQAVRGVLPDRGGSISFLALDTPAGPDALAT